MTRKILPVIYRRFRDGDVIALFPTIRERNGDVLSYMHIGQHGAASPQIIRDTKPATLAEPDVAALHEELTGIYTTRPALRPIIYGAPVTLAIRKRMTRP